MKNLIFILLMIPLLGFAQWGSDIYECKLPTCTTILRNISANYQELGYIVTSNGGCSFSYTGLIYSNTNPNVNYGSYDGAYLGPRSSGFLDQGLTTYTFAPGTTVYFRAMAINYKGIGYGDIVSFTVPGGTSPSVSILAATSITSTSAIVGGNVTAQGSSFVTARGITWGTNPQNSYVNDINCGNGTGSYTTIISGLTSGVTYYYSAYATNSNGTTLSSMGSFTATSSQSFPTLVTNSISSVTTNYAISGGNSIFDGNATIVAKGVCWSTTPNPNTSNSKTDEGGGTANFTSNITGLNPATTYYVRAYAKNKYDNGSFISYAVGYGNELSFTTSGNLPTVSNDLTAYNVTASSAQAVGEVTSDGGLSVIARGFVYSLSSSSDPTTTTNLGSTSNGSGTGGFSASITGLNSVTSYKFRAYAINSAGTSYGTIVNFTTVSVACNLASLTTTSVTNITENSANSGGNISNDGGCSIIGGVCWNTTGSPTILNSHTTDISGIGAFSSSITGLTCGTTYYVRAYATNSSGTSYGNEVSFTAVHTPQNQFLLSYAVSTALCGTYNFTESESLACQALSEFYSTSCRGITQSTMSGLFVSISTSSLMIGIQTYRKPTPNSTYWCLNTDTGYYVNLNANNIVHLVNGVIQSITTCP